MRRTISYVPLESLFRVDSSPDFVLHAFLRRYDYSRGGIVSDGCNTGDCKEQRAKSGTIRETELVPFRIQEHPP